MRHRTPIAGLALAALFLVLACACACSRGRSKRPGPEATVTGTVVDAATGAPVEETPTGGLARDPWGVGVRLSYGRMAP